MKPSSHPPPRANTSAEAYRASGNAIPFRRSVFFLALFSLSVMTIFLSGRRIFDDGSSPTLAMHSKGVYTGNPWVGERTVSVKTLGETPFARCDVHSVKSAGGGSEVIRDWIFMEERDAINVAVHAAADGKFLLFEQEKYAIHGKTLSPVGGMIEDRESPFEAARREVFEELGVGSPNSLGRKEFTTSRRNDDVPLDEYGELDGSVPPDEPDWVYLGAYRTAANRGGGFLYSYLLINAVPLVEGGGTTEYKSTGDDESQKVLRLTKKEVENAIVKAKFKEIKWAATLSLAMLHIQSKEGVM